MKEINRDRYLNSLISKRENGLVKIIIGMKGCGKSYLLFKLYRDYLISQGVKEEQIISIDLEDIGNKKFRDLDTLYGYLTEMTSDKSKMYYIFLDEVQFAISDEEIKSGDIGLYSVLNGLLRRENVDVYVTGSNSKFLSSDVMTEFRGRGDEVRVYPLSFREFMSAYEGDMYQGYGEYSMYGGLPLILSRKGDEEKAKYLTSLCEQTYKKDVVERYKLRGDVVLGSVTDVLASSVGSLTNPTKLSDTFNSKGIKTNKNTVSTYISYLEDAFMISKAKRYDVKGRKYIGSPCKYYFTDIGIRNARLNFSQQEPTHIMENIIYNELVSRGYNVDVGVVEYYKRDENGKLVQKKNEVDFVCNKGSRRYYILSAYHMDDEEKVAREQASFDHIDDSFKKITVVMQNTLPWMNDKGYLTVNALDFLLNENSLDL